MGKVSITLTALVAICLAGSFIPFLGVLFALPLHDLIILLLSVLAVLIIPSSKKFRILLIPVFWVALSLILDIPRLGAYINGAPGISSPLMVVHSKLNQTPKELSLHGNLNTILYAAGPRLAVAMDINVAGMRSLNGTALFNRASTYDIPDEVFNRGWIPRIDMNSYPRMTVNRRFDNKSEYLYISIQKSQNETIATFQRSFPLPPEHPGSDIAGLGFILQIFNDNFLRFALDLNRVINLHSELNKFFNLTLGQRIENPEKLPFAIINFSQSDIKIPPEKIGDSTDKYIVEMNSLWQDSAEETFLERCPFAPQGKEFGSDESGRTYVRLAKFKQQSDVPVVLAHIDPYYIAFSYFCSSTLDHFFSFADFDKNLKISKFDLNGRVSSVHYISKPFRTERPLQIIEASVLKSEGEISGFSLAMPIVTKHSPHIVQVKDSFRRTDIILSRERPPKFDQP